MENKKRAAPLPRVEVASPDLTRPDWTKGAVRKPAVLWLDKNENTDPELSAVVAGVVRGLPSETFFTYPESADLYVKLARFLDVKPENLLLAAGSDGVIRSVFEAYVAPGDAVIHTVPTFAMYSVYSRMYGAKTVPLEYRPSNRGPVLDVDDIIDAIRSSQPRLACLPNPDSPTGTVFSSEDLRAIVGAAEEAGAIMLIDEAYHPFYEPTAISWVKDFSNLVVARSTGKAWGMAGLRIGYAAASPEIAQMLHKVRPMYEANTVGVAAFEKMLDHADAMQASVARLNRGKAEFLDAMESLGYRVLRGQGNFLHVAFGDDAAKIHAALADTVYYRKDFNEACLKGFSRFSAAPPDVMQRIIQEIRQAAGRGS